MWEGLYIKMKILGLYVKNFKQNTQKNISENDIEQNYEVIQQKEWDMCNHFEEWIKTRPDKEHALKEFYAKCGIKY